MAETMVKTTVGDILNSAIESVQDEYDMNKSEAVRFLLQEGHMNYHSEADKERIAQ